MSDTQWLTVVLVLGALVMVATALGGCAGLTPTIQFSQGEHQPDPALQAAADAWQAKQQKE